MRFQRQAKVNRVTAGAGERFLKSEEDGDFGIWNLDATKRAPAVPSAVVARRQIRLCPLLKSQGRGEKQMV